MILEEGGRTGRPFSCVAIERSSHAPRRARDWCQRSRSSFFLQLFLLAGTKAWLPSGRLLAWRRGNDLDLFLLGFLGLTVAFLLALADAGLSLGLIDVPLNAGCHIDL